MPLSQEKIGKYLEAERRGILKGDKLARFQEAKRRGLISQTEAPNPLKVGASEALSVAGETAKAVKTSLFPSPGVTPSVMEPIPRQFGLGAFQSASFGYGLPLAKMAGGEDLPILQPPQTPGEKAARFAGGVAGAVIPGLVGFSQAPFKVVGALRKIALGTGRGLITGAAFNPSEKEITGLKERIPGAVAGAGLGAALPLLGAAYQKIAKFPTTRVGQSQIIQKVDDDMYYAYKKMIQKYGETLDEQFIKYPNQKANITEVVADIVDDMSFETVNPGVKRAVNSSPALKKIVDKFKAGITRDAENLTARDVQNILNELGVNQDKQLGRVMAKDLPRYNLYNKLKGEMVNTFEEMAPMRQEYAEFKDAYDAVRKMRNSVNFLDNTRKHWNNPLVRDNLDFILTKEGIKELGGYKNAANALSVLKWVGISGIGLYGIRQASRGITEAVVGE